MDVEGDWIYKRRLVEDGVEGSIREKMLFY